MDHAEPLITAPLLEVGGLAGRSEKSLSKARTNPGACRMLIDVVGGCR